MMIRKTCCFFLLCLLLSCDKEESTPSFLEVSEFNLSTGTFEGENSQEITDVKVSANGQNLGIFGLPANVPILEEGNTDIILSPVIKQDGLSTTRVVYPFYTLSASTENLVSAETTSISPTTSYRENLTFWLENFDNSISFNEEVNSEGQFERIDDSSIIFGGEGASASAVLNDGGIFFYAESDEDFFWPLGQAIFLELDYSCNHPFIIGAYSRSGVSITRSDLIIVNASTVNSTPNWRKLYINLTDFRANNVNTDELEFYFKFSKDNDFPEPEVYLDNLKVIY